MTDHTNISKAPEEIDAELFKVLRRNGPEEPAYSSAFCRESVRRLRYMIENERAEYAWMPAVGPAGGLWEMGAYDYSQRANYKNRTAARVAGMIDLMTSTACGFRDHGASHSIADCPISTVVY